MNFFAMDTPLKVLKITRKQNQWLGAVLEKKNLF